jgi:hypothetical protein
MGNSNRVRVCDLEEGSLIVLRSEAPSRKIAVRREKGLQFDEQNYDFLLLSNIVAAALSGDEVSRPRILGISHMALFVSDLQKSRWFYEDFLGYAEPYNLKRDDGSVRIAFIKSNENQYIELFTASVTRSAAGDRRAHPISSYKRAFRP